MPAQSERPSQVRDWVNELPQSSDHPGDAHAKSDRG